MGKAYLLPSLKARLLSYDTSTLTLNNDPDNRTSCQQLFRVNAHLTGFWFQRFVYVLFWSFAQNWWNWQVTYTAVFSSLLSK